MKRDVSCRASSMRLGVKFNRHVSGLSQFVSNHAVCHTVLLYRT